MQETISLIASDTYGNPEPDSPLGHYVRVTARTNPARINQLTDGGKFPHADCADACIRSLLIDLTGSAPTEPIVEADADTTATGTQVYEVADALNRLLPKGWSAAVLNGTPTRDTVMNPLGGRIVPPLQWAPYGHASRGVYINVVGPAAPTTAQASSSTPFTQKDDEIMPKVVTTVRTAGQPADPNGAGAVYLVANWPYGPKRHINAVQGAAVPAYLAACGQTQVEVVNADLLDRCEDGPEIKNDYVNEPGEVTSPTPIPASD